MNILHKSAVKRFLQESQTLYQDEVVTVEEVAVEMITVEMVTIEMVRVRVEVVIG